MTTASRQQCRAVLHGCVHRPKFSTMSPPRKGDFILCHPCGRERLVVGIETGWKYAYLNCVNCSWAFASEKAGKKRLLVLARRHADGHTHNVDVTHDGHVERIKGQRDGQLRLIDDLLMPD